MIHASIFILMFSYIIEDIFLLESNGINGVNLCINEPKLFQTIPRQGHESWIMNVRIKSLSYFVN